MEYLTTDERTEFVSFVESINTKQAEQKRSSLLKNVKSSPKIFEFPRNPERYVNNLSSLTLDKYLLEALCLGFKFCIPRTKIRQLDLEVQFENLYGQLSKMQPTSSLELERFKSTLTNASYQHLHSKATYKQLLSKETS